MNDKKEKKLIYAQYLLAHFLLMLLGGMVTVAEVYLSKSGAVSPVWALMVVPMALGAYVTGRKLRVERLEKADDCWNAAMALYVVSLVLLALLWKFTQSKAALIVNVWNLPTAPALLGVDALIGNRVLPHGGNGFFALLRSTEQYHRVYLPIMGALLIALEPLCLTLGFLHGAKKTKEEGKSTDA